MANAKDSDASLILSFLESVRRRCPDHLPTLEALGDLYTKAGRYQDGCEIDLLLTRRDDANDTYWYNLACSYARLGKTDLCLASLRRSVELGYDNAEWMMQDEDLASLRDHPDFMKIIARLHNAVKSK